MWYLDTSRLQSILGTAVYFSAWIEQIWECSQWIHISRHCLGIRCLSGVGWQGFLVGVVISCEAGRQCFMGIGGMIVVLLKRGSTMCRGGVGWQGFLVDIVISCEADRQCFMGIGGMIVILLERGSTMCRGIALGWKCYEMKNKNLCNLPATGNSRSFGDGAGGASEEALLLSSPTGCE